jgi:hypothetical protein
MKAIRYTLLTITFLIAILYGVAYYFDFNENIYSYYPTFEATQTTGSAKEGGWIPEIVPSSATEIHEQHNIDTNEVWLRFDIPSTEKNKMISGLRKLSHQEIERIHLRYPWRAGDWWFEGVIQQEPYNDNALNAEIYMTENEIYFLAFDCCSSRVYYWEQH